MPTPRTEHGPTIVYVAGPMTGWKQYNYPMFKHVTSQLRAQGYEVLCPTEVHDKHCPNGCTDPGAHDREWYMEHCLRMVDQSHIICLLPDWNTSIGACREVDRARAFGKLTLPHHLFEVIL